MTNQIKEKKIKEIDNSFRIYVGDGVLQKINEIIARLNEIVDYLNDKKTSP